MTKKKINGLAIELQKKSNIFLVRNRRGDTVESTNNITRAIDFAKKDRRYVKYEPNIGGLESKKITKSSSSSSSKKKDKTKK